MWTAATRIGWGFLVTGAVLTAVSAARYYTFDPEVYFQPEVYEDMTLGLMTHITAMMLAVLAGPFQFLRSLRERHLGIHRTLGRIYVAGAVVGALSGLYLARSTAAGPASDAGFTLLGLGVLLTTTVGFVRIRQGNVRSHREWMTRGYALVFGAVTLRLFVTPLQGALGEHDGYAVVAWACWIPNLVVAEWLIRSGSRRHPGGPAGGAVSATRSSRLRV